MIVNKASTCFSALLCAVLFSSGCRERPKPEGSKPETSTITINQTISIELVKLPRLSEPIPAYSTEWFGQFEVTQAQWETIMGNNPSQFKAPNNPVEQVSWDDCQEFLEKLNELPAVKQSSLKFRLPTEEEWEYACRAGATGDYCRLADGTEITKDTLGQVAWFEDNSNEKTHPVGKKKPNAFGLYDMHGNVYEWTATAVDEDRVIRGGCLDGSAKFCKSSDRNGGPHYIQNRSIGFRLCAETEAGRKAREDREAAERKAREERKAAERKAREERKAAEQKAKEEARQAALSWKSESKRIQISSSVAIELQSVPGPLWFGSTEVTLTQWEAVMGENSWGGEQPVANVSWWECREFLKKLNALPSVKESGLTFRLPKDSEWEYACRAGAAGNYCLLADGTEVSKDTLGQVAWFEDNADEWSHPVGQKKPNAFGLYDMLGNVWEWCEEELGEVMPSAKGKDYEHNRVIHGGSWRNPAWCCVSSPSSGHDPFESFPGDNIGFRLCADGRQ